MSFKHAVAMAIILSAILAPAVVQGDAETELNPAIRRYNGFYISLTSSKYSDFPLSRDNRNVSRSVPFSDWPVISSNSSSLDFAFGYAFSGFWKYGYFGAELEHSAPRFSDYRVDDRKICLWNLFLDLGVILPIPHIPIVLCATLGGGWLHQLDYKSYGSGYENLQENVFPTIVGFGLKVSPLKNVILELEFKHLLETFVEGTGTSHPDIPGAETGRYGANSLGDRLAFGLTYIFGPKIGFLPWR